MTLVQSAAGIPRSAIIGTIGIPPQEPASSAAAQTSVAADLPPSRVHFQAWHAALCAVISAEAVGRASIYNLHRDDDAAETEKARAEAWASLGRLIEAIRDGERSARIRLPHLHLVANYANIYLRQYCRGVLTGAQMKRRMVEMAQFQEAITGALRFGEVAR